VTETKTFVLLWASIQKSVCQEISQDIIRAGPVSPRQLQLAELIPCRHDSSAAKRAMRLHMAVMLHSTMSLVVGE